MPTIRLVTEIKAPRQRVFDLSRSVEIHLTSTQKTGEQAIAGKKSGLMELDDWVTWKARHLGRSRTFTSLITEYEYPVRFIDEMVQGDFKYFRHEHRFEEKDGRTIMTDILDFQSPYGWIGRWVDRWFMKSYLTRFLTERNQCIRDMAEPDLKDAPAEQGISAKTA